MDSAIGREPVAFLFDEPLSNLDAALRVNMRLEIFGQKPDVNMALVQDPVCFISEIVSLTITAGGYFINPATVVIDPGDPAIARDGAEPDRPKTVFGLIVAGLKQRHAKDVAPFTVMSCDNLLHNDRLARNAVVGLAKLSDPQLAEMKDIYGDTADANRFAAQFSAWLKMLWAQSAQATLQHYLADGR